MARYTNMTKQHAAKIYDMAEAAQVAIQDADEIPVPAYLNKLIGDAEKALRAIMDACADEPRADRGGSGPRLDRELPEGGVTCRSRQWKSATA